MSHHTAASHLYASAQLPQPFFQDDPLHVDMRGKRVLLF
jgi:hypothetical protein